MFDYIKIFALPSVVVGIVSYLLGSISFSIIFTRLFDHHTDIRTLGSGNAGATNVLRTVGTKAALFTFIFDFSKSAVSVLLGRYVFEYMGSLAGIPAGTLQYASQYGAYIAGALCVIGHIFPVYFGFKGGKGVLTSCAMIAMIDWRVFIVAMSVFFIVLAVSRMVSLASICGAATFPIATFFITFFVDYRTGQNNPGFVPLSYVLVTTGIALLMAVILIVKHKSNIKRILNGTESKLSVHKKSS